MPGKHSWLPLRCFNNQHVSQFPVVRQVVLGVFSQSLSGIPENHAPPSASDELGKGVVIEEKPVGLDQKTRTLCYAANPWTDFRLFRISVGTGGVSYVIPRAARI